MKGTELLIHKLYCVYYLLVTYIVSAWFLILQLIQSHNKPKIGNENGRVAMITGGGTGIGYNASNQLLKAGMTVIIAGIERDQQEGVRNLQKIYKHRVKFLECDLSSLKSVKQAVSQFKEWNIPLHVLVNNAGVMFAPQRITEEGFESHWVINYLSHFLLTHLLFKTLVQSASKDKPSRIVNLSSCLHYPGTINFKDIQGRNCYSAEFAYNQSKLAMVIFSTTLYRKLKRVKDASLVVIPNAVHPAVAFSGLYKFIWWSSFIPGLAKRILHTPEMGSDTVVHAAVSPSVKSGGKYFHNCEEREPSREAKSMAVGERLWRLSCSQAGIEKFDIVG